MSLVLRKCGRQRATRYTTAAVCLRAVVFDDLQGNDKAIYFIAPHGAFHGETVRLLKLFLRVALDN